MTKRRLFTVLQEVYLQDEPQYISVAELLSIINTAQVDQVKEAIKVSLDVIDILTEYYIGKENPDGERSRLGSHNVGLCDKFYGRGRARAPRRNSGTLFKLFLRTTDMAEIACDRGVLPKYLVFPIGFDVNNINAGQDLYNKHEVRNKYIGEQGRERKKLVKAYRNFLLDLDALVTNSNPEVD